MAVCVCVCVCDSTAGSLHQTGRGATTGCGGARSLAGAYDVRVWVGGAYDVRVWVGGAYDVRVWVGGAYDVRVWVRGEGGHTRIGCVCIGSGCLTTTPPHQTCRRV